MSKQTRRRVLLIGAAVLLALIVVSGFFPDPIPVEVATVQRGPLQVVVEEEGETRLVDRYVVSSPVAAYLRRIELEPGDRIQQGQPVVRLEPPRAAILDPRSQAEAAGRVEVARASLAEATVAAQRAEAERERTQRLFEGGAATRQALEQATALAEQARAGLNAARAEVAAAEAALRSQSGTSPAGQRVPEALHAPAAGRVLAVHRRSEGPVNAGEPLIEVGDTERLQVRVDVLSQDAVRIRPGARVIIDQWGGDTPLEAVVTRVEPEGFTRVSALGVEERRVPVLANIVSPPEAWAGLGSGYRVVARVILWEAPEILKVPTSALFRTEQGWAAFVVENGTAQRRPVQIGQQAGLEAQVLEGLEAGQEVVVHPPNTLEDGARVQPRQQKD